MVSVFEFPAIKTTFDSMKNRFEYSLDLLWLGNENGVNHGDDRLYEINISGKETIKGSADEPFFGDPSLYNPEDLLISALSACHMMSFLYLCRKSGIKVASYVDNPLGVLKINNDGSGEFENVTLKPIVVLSDSTQINKASKLHAQAGKLCFIANSVNFKIKYDFKFKY